MDIIPASDLLEREVAPAETEACRIAILSTPRTGNTWLRRLLDSIYSLPQVVADTPGDVDWDQLPSRCILQLHWPLDIALQSVLSKHEFKVVTLFRNPCDTLISILHFATVWKNTNLWMGGLKGDETSIVGTRPCSREFAEYVSSERAKLLISASADWAETEGCLTVSYESLVHDTTRELIRATEHLQPAPAEVISAAIEANSIAKLRSSVQNQHFWRGQPGIWKTLLPHELVRDIYRHHSAAFEAMSYPSNDDHRLSQSEADANWTGLELATMRQEMAESRRQLKQATDELNQSRWKIRDLEVAFEKAHASIEPLVEVGPTILSLSTRVNRITRFCGGAMASIRHHLGLNGKSIRKGCET
ncbi:MAG: sulfotransferase domain-containing protein [Planctomycetaceae bacterium]|nr:sulfotransferase domain-containing protein [Planctomycetales bacterium]MCB9923349.1 sulfotransferase domain-containing protein [Planctomycetaceae bacterium]